MRRRWGLGVSLALLCLSAGLLWMSGVFSPPRTLPPAVNPHGAQEGRPSSLGPQTPTLPPRPAGQPSAGNRGTSPPEAGVRVSGLVLDAQGPVPDALVQVEDAPDVSATHTDAEGRFAVENVRPGRRVLAASHEGLQVRQWVLVRAEEDREAVELVLASGLRLGGHVTDEGGRALADVAVSLLGGTPLLKKQTQTDPQGRFRFEPLAPGRYEMTLQAARHALQKMPARWFEASEELTFSLKQAERVEGHVVDERGTPVEGVQLSLVTGRGRSPSALDSRSQADGAFFLDAPRAGSWQIQAWHPDFLPGDFSLSAPTRDARLVLHGGGSLDVEVVDEEGLPQVQAEVVLDARGVTTGAEGKALFRTLPPGRHTLKAFPREGGRHAEGEAEVRDGELSRLRLQLETGWTLSGQVVDTRGDPLEGVNLLAWNPSHGWPQSKPRERSFPVSVRTTSGPEGRFTLTNLERADWLIRSEESELDPHASRGVEDAGDNVGRIASGSSQVRLVLLPGLHVRGRVLHESGEPVTSFQANTTPVETPDGRFSVPLPRRGMRLFIQAPGLSQAMRSLPPGSHEDVELGDVVLSSPRTMKGQVVDARTSEPVARALVRVRAWRADDQSLTYTLPDGRFTLEGVLPLEGSALVVEHPDHASRAIPFSSAQQDVRVELEPWATLEGRVEVEGTPVEVGTLQVRSEQGDPKGLANIWRGRYLLRALPAGRHMVMVSGPRDEGPAVLFPLRPVELAPGDRVTLDFTAQRTGAAVEVLVPEPGIEVHLLPGPLPLIGPRDGLYRKLSAGFMGKGTREGIRRFSYLPSGAYTLVALRRDETGTEVHVEPLEVPVEGTVTFTLLPDWTRFEDP